MPRSLAGVIGGALIRKAWLTLLPGRSDAPTIWPRSLMKAASALSPPRLPRSVTKYFGGAARVGDGSSNVVKTEHAVANIALAIRILPPQTGESEVYHKLNCGGTEDGRIALIGN